MATTFLDPDPGPSKPGDVFAVCLDGVAAELAAVAQTPTWGLGDDTLVDRLRQALAVRAGVNELVARLLATTIDRDLPRQHGAASPTSWLVSEHRLSRGQATATVAAARALSPAEEHTRQAWAAGRLHTDQAVMIGATLSGLSADVDDQPRHLAQATLVDQAQLLTHTDLQRACHHLIEVIDPAGAEQRLGDLLNADEQRGRVTARLTVRKTGDGTSRLTAQIPDLHADILRAALEAYTAPRHPTPTTDRGSGDPGGDSTGDLGGSERDRLPYPQRLGTAFCELLEHLPTSKLPQHGVANATIVVTVALRQLQSGLGEATLDTGTTISAGQARRLACNADLIPAILDGTSRVLDLGRTRRLYTRHQRIALAVRDRGCIFPGCDRPPTWCEAHHLTAWSRGGYTDTTTGCLLCPFHHHLIHHSDWAATMAPDGTPEIIPPARLDPHQTPRRHTRFKPRPG